MKLEALTGWDESIFPTAPGPSQTALPPYKCWMSLYWCPSPAVQLSPFQFLH